MMGQSISSPQHTILVVDDDALLRYELVDMLEEHGYSVLDASDADDAIHVMELHPDIRAVVTDVQMPGSMDGIKLVHFIRNRWPPVALFVVSAQKLGDEWPLPDRAVFYPKPLDGRRFLQDLNMALDR